MLPIAICQTDTSHHVCKPYAGMEPLHTLGRAAVALALVSLLAGAPPFRRQHRLAQKNSARRARNLRAHHLVHSCECDPTHVYKVQSGEGLGVRRNCYSSFHAIFWVTNEADFTCCMYKAVHISRICTRWVSNVRSFSVRSMHGFVNGEPSTMSIDIRSSVWRQP